MPNRRSAGSSRKSKKKKGDKKKKDDSSCSSERPTEFTTSHVGYGQRAKRSTSRAELEGRAERGQKQSEGSRGTSSKRAGAARGQKQSEGSSGTSSKRADAAIEEAPWRGAGEQKRSTRTTSMSLLATPKDREAAAPSTPGGRQAWQAEGGGGTTGTASGAMNASAVAAQAARSTNAQAKARSATCVASLGTSSSPAKSMMRTTRTIMAKGVVRLGKVGNLGQAARHPGHEAEGMRKKSLVHHMIPKGNGSQAMKRMKSLQKCLLRGQDRGRIGHEEAARQRSRGQGLAAHRRLLDQTGTQTTSTKKSCDAEGQLSSEQGLELRS